MGKKRVDRRPDQRPTGPGAGTDPGNPEAGRMLEELPGRRGFEKPAGRPIDKSLPTPGAGGRSQDIFEEGRSDRESGRPVQLEEDEERSDRESGRAVQLEEDDGEVRTDRKLGRPVQLEGAEPQKGRQGRSPREVEPTTR